MTKTVNTINPATQEDISSYSFLPYSRIEENIEHCHKAWQEWRETSFSHRSKLMLNLADQLEKQKEPLSHLMTEEMGKPLKDSTSEIEKCAWVCRYYAEHAENFLKDELIESDASKSFVTYQPLGLVLAIMPWNFPFWQVFRFAAPSIMAGNVALLKHAPNVLGCGEAIAALFREAGFPDHIFQHLIMDTNTTAELIANPLVKAVTLTGSTKAGKAVASQAGKHLKKCVLELGGSDPYILLDDADLDLAADVCVSSRLINNGQSCISAKRFIVTSQNKEAFTKKVIQKMQEYTFGDPKSGDHALGTMAREDLREQLDKQVKASIEAGAKCLLGGTIPDGKGWYYPPTVLTEITRDMPAYREELFGPVASIIEARDEAHAVEIANDSSYGLGGAVFSKDEKRAEKIARTEVQTGNCFVNTFVKSDPRLPFGGINESGFGRELSHHGIKEFVNIKTVYVK